MNCPVCASEQNQVFYRAYDVPVHQNMLYPTAEAARASGRGDIELAICAHCGFVWNSTFDPGLLNYSEHYDNTQCFSGMFNQYVEDEVQLLVNRYGLHSKFIVEIGCGKGDFIRRLCEIGNNTGIGFDPSYIGPDTQLDGRLSFVREFYTPQHTHAPADLYCSRHVIEHVPEPVGLLHTIREAIRDGQQPAVFFETPDVRWIFQRVAFWDVFYEHCSLFTPNSLTYLYNVCGFETTHATNVFGDQYMWVAGQPAHGTLKQSMDNAASIMQEALHFAGQCEAKINQMREKLQALQNAGKKLVVWGAGAKGVTFLNTLQPEHIEYVVDVNPRKQGKYMAGTAQQIVAPEALKTIRPDVILVMNPNYHDEIRASLEQMQCACETLVI